MSDLSAPTGYSSSDLVFNDDFSGTSLGSTWKPYITSAAAGGTAWDGNGSGGSNEGGPYIDNYDTASQVSVNNGLTLTATKQNITGVNGGSSQTYPYTSGAVSSYGSFEFTGGYLQISMQQPSGNGDWPSLWLLPGSGSKGTGDNFEIDMQEGGMTNGSSSTNDNLSWHLHTNSGTFGGVTNVGTDLTSGYHTYGIDWEPGKSITYYLDGKAVGEITSAQTAIPDEPMEVIMSNAVGTSAASSFHTAADASTPSSMPMKIADVQLYQKAGSGETVTGKNVSASSSAGSATSGSGSTGSSSGTATPTGTKTGTTGSVTSGSSSGTSGTGTTTVSGTGSSGTTSTATSGSSASGSSTTSGGTGGSASSGTTASGGTTTGSVTQPATGSTSGSSTAGQTGTGTGTASGAGSVTDPTAGTGSVSKPGGTSVSTGTSGGTTTSKAPSVTVADPTLSVSPGRQNGIDLGVNVSVPKAGDNVTVNIKGLPGYETITDKLDHKTFSGSNITLTAAEANSGLTLTSSYKGTGHPTAALTVTATDHTNQLSSAAQSIAVTDPSSTSVTATPGSGSTGSTSTAASSSGVSGSGSSSNPTQSSVTDPSSTSVTSASGSTGTTSTAAGSSGTCGSGSSWHGGLSALHAEVSQWFDSHPDFAKAAKTLSDAVTSKSGAATSAAGSSTDSAASAGNKAYALLNQMMASDFGSGSHFAQGGSSSAQNQQQTSSLLTRPLH